MLMLLRGSCGIWSFRRCGPNLTLPLHGIALHTRFDCVEIRFERGVFEGLSTGGSIGCTALKRGIGASALSLVFR